MTNQSDNGTGHNHTITYGAHNHNYDYMHYFSLACVILPGFVINSVALIFLIKDIRKAVFPAIILLLMLCSSDLAAVIFSTIHVSVSLTVTDITYALCAAKSVPHTFFQLYAGVLNAMMSIDRVMAICFPFFYKRNIQVSTWKFGSLVAAFCTAMFNIFPVIGLGDVIMSVRFGGHAHYYCSTFTYWSEPRKRIFGTLYGMFGFVIVLLIVLGNSMVIRSVMKMRTRITSSIVEPSSSTDSTTSNTANVTSAEIAFAKLMGCLALVYLTCGMPYNVSHSFFLFVTKGLI